MRICFLACALAALLVPAVPAETYVVNPQATGDFPTIQAAADGDVIALTTGFFLGDGNRDVSYLGDDLTIRSRTGDPSTCIIDCQATLAAQHRAFVFECNETRDAVLEAVTIRNACHYRGGAMEGPGRLTLDRCLIAFNVQGGLRPTSVP